MSAQKTFFLEEEFRRYLASPECRESGEPFSPSSINGYCSQIKSIDEQGFSEGLGDDILELYHKAYDKGGTTAMTEISEIYHKLMDNIDKYFDNILETHSTEDLEEKKKSLCKKCSNYRAYFTKYSDFLRLELVKNDPTLSEKYKEIKNAFKDIELPLAIDSQSPNLVSKSNNIPNSFFLEDEFRLYLASPECRESGEPFQPNSINNYCSKMKNFLDNGVFLEGLSDNIFEDFEKACSSDGNIAIRIESIYTRLMYNINKYQKGFEVGNPEYKKCTDYKSYFTKYYDFLNWKFVEEDLILLEEDADNEDDFCIDCSKKDEEVTAIISLQYDDLMTNFKRRLKTQDRVGKIAYPIRFISYLVNNTELKCKKEEFNDWVTDTANNIKVYSKDKCYKLADVESITIYSNGEVRFSTSEVKDELMYTPDTKQELAPMENVSLMKHIQIDHKYPIAKVLNESTHEFPTLYQYSKRWNKYKDIYSICRSIVHGKLEKEFIPLFDKLFEEMKCVLSKTEDLQLMSKYHNQRKK